MDTKKCTQCGEVFQRDQSEWKSRWEKRRFCSTRCWQASRRGIARPEIRRRVIKECLACGKSFEAGGRSGHRGASRFCSRSCASAARWRTGSRAVRLAIERAAYLAGLVDGEGSIILYKRGKGCAMRMSVASTYRPVLEWCRTTTGVGNIIEKPIPSHGRHKASYAWLVNSQAAASVLEQIRPYLIIKGEQADMAMDFQSRLKIPAEKALKEWQEQWRARICSMNARGPKK